MTSVSPPACLVFPLHLKHEDGRVLWLAEYQTDTAGEATSVSINASDAWLGACYDPTDQETFALMGMTDEEMQAEFGEVYGVPDHLWAARVNVREEALLALLRSETPAPEYLVPQDFHRNHEAYRDPAYHVTRAQVQQAQVERTARREQAQNRAPERNPQTFPF